MLFAFNFDVLNHKLGKRGAYFILCVFLIFLAGLRYRVGGDTLNYMVYHKFIPDLFHIDLFTPIVGVNKEVGWIFLSSVAKLFGDEFYWIQFLQATIVNVGVFIFFKRHTKFYFTGVLFYYITFYLYFNFEILRESVAISIFILYGLKYILAKKYKMFYLTVGFMTLFHTSAVFLILLPLLLKFSSKNYNYFYICTAIYVVGLIISPFFYDFLKSDAVSSIFADKFNLYLDYNFTVYGKIQAYLIYIVLPLVAYRYTKKTQNVFLVFLVAYAVLGSLTSLFTIFFRFLNYFTPVLILEVTSLFVVILKNKRDRLRVQHSFFLIIFVFIVANVKILKTVDTNRDIKWYSNWYPYYSVFEQKADPDREYIWLQQFNK